MRGDDVSISPSDACAATVCSEVTLEPYFAQLSLNAGLITRQLTDANPGAKSVDFGFTNDV
jgi:hypothetical protein